MVAEPVAAGRAADGLDGVAELPQPLDVLAHGPLADAQQRRRARARWPSPGPGGGRAGRTAGTTSGATWDLSKVVAEPRQSGPNRAGFVPTVPCMTTHQNPSQTLTFRPFTVSVTRTRSTTSTPASPTPASPRSRPTRAGTDDWSAGTPVSYLRRDGRALADGFDWRAQEERMNAYPQLLTEIDGQTIHVVHVRSANEDATPLLLLHTYPGSFVDFLDLIPHLTDDFHLVIPTIPGVGFSQPLTDGAWDSRRNAARLGPPDARPRLRVLRRPRLRQRRDRRARARDAGARGLPRRARAAAVLLPLRRPGGVREDDARPTTPRSSSPAGSRRSTATPR